MSRRKATGSHGVLWKFGFRSSATPREHWSLPLPPTHLTLPHLNSTAPSMSDECTPHHDWLNALLTFGLCCGLVISYLPQHFRIIHAKSSEGFSPVFLLLGTTSAACGMFNMITLQAPIVKCCRVVSFGSCAEMTAGVVQVSLQWICFGFVFVLYMIYYPQHLRYAGIRLDTEQPLSSADHSTSKTKTKTGVRSAEWRLSVILAWITVAHFVFVALTTAYLLSTTNFPLPPSPAPLPPTPPTPSPAPAPTPIPNLPPQISAWATLLGLSSASLAAIQYAPQLAHTYRTKLVGALSVPMMCIQTPGGVLMVLSIVWRPGTNWTSWITFAVAALLQGCLLAMCIAWKIRQRRLGIDDFGNAILAPLPSESSSSSSSTSSTTQRNARYGATDTESSTRAGNVEDVQVEEVEDIVPVPGLVTTPSEDPRAVRAVLAAALESAAESRLVDAVGDERTPLLGAGSAVTSGGASGSSSKQESEEVKGWQAWFRR